jgi:hypothetical protein
VWLVWGDVLLRKMGSDSVVKAGYATNLALPATRVRLVIGHVLRKV